MLPYAPITIGISSCLLGEDVRYDGRNKYDSYIVETLGQYVDFLPVCPETAIGLGVPRPPLGLLRMNGRIAAVGVDNPAINVSKTLTDFARKQAALLGTVSGYIFKSRSPSCGLVDTPVITEGEAVYGPGLYTRQIIEALPLLPVTDEALLKQEKPANNFLEQAFAFERWQQLLGKPVSASRLHLFHTLHTEELTRHHTDIDQQLTDFLFSAEDPALEETARNYMERFMAALKLPSLVEMQASELLERHRWLSTALGNHTD